MYFDQFGQAKACCQQNQYMALGRVADGGILNAWNSDHAKDLRAAMHTEELHPACGFCIWQRRHAPVEAVFARTFDHLDTGSHEFPQQLEFAISSVCNLQCVMCDGDFSSSIRAHRDQLPARPEVYKDAFFYELCDVMPYVSAVRMYGGEPLLARPSLRVLDIVADVNPGASVTITTNATIWNRQVERILCEIHPSVVVSLDAMSRDTYEHIRQGATFDAVMENIDRYEQAGAQISLTFCLMTENWHEFPDLLEFATERAFDVGVNTVLRPDALSLYTLPQAELRRVVGEMSAQEHRVAGSPLQRVWAGRIHELESYLDNRESQVTIRQGSPWDAGVMSKTDDRLYETAPGTDLPDMTVEVFFLEGRTEVVTGPCQKIVGTTNDLLTGLDVAGLVTALSVVDSQARETRPRAVFQLHRSDGLPALEAVEHSDRWWISRL